MTGSDLFLDDPDELTLVSVLFVFCGLEFSSLVDHGDSLCGGELSEIGCTVVSGDVVVVDGFVIDRSSLAAIRLLFGGITLVCGAGIDDRVPS